MLRRQFVFAHLVIMLTLANIASAQQQTFHGTLQRHLSADPDFSSSYTILDRGNYDALQTLKLEAQNVAEVYTGTLSFGKLPASNFGVAVVTLKSGEKFMYLDSRHEGKLKNPGRVVFVPAPKKAYYSATAQLSVPLKAGPFSKLPVSVFLSRDTSAFRLKEGQMVLNFGDPFVEGSVQLPSRRLLVRYEYDLDSHGVDVAWDREWFDVNGDGKIDNTRSSPERGAPPPRPPIFHVGRDYLQTAKVDVAAGLFELKTVKGNLDRIELRVGAHIPDFTFQDFSGTMRKLSDVKGKYILLDFWATWCVPCVADLPSKKAAYDRFHAKGFEILGMNGDPEIAAPDALLKKLEITWPEAKFDSDLFAKKLGIGSWPTLVLIDEHGTIISTSQANHLPLSGKNLEKSLETLLY